MYSNKTIDGALHWLKS